MIRPAVAVALVLAFPLSSWAATLFYENFDVDPTANWTVNAGPSDHAANFFFDYSTVGIPSAPNSSGTTRGLKLQANLTTGIFGGFSVSPTGQHFGSGDYQLAFDWWSNFNGPFPAGGNGSTNLSTFGIGTAGNTAQWPGGVQDSAWFAATGDGSSASDWRAYTSAAPTSYPDGSPVYEAPTRNASDPYYAGFGGVGAPAAQVALFPGQAGITAVGSAGMEWHQVVITKSTYLTFPDDSTLFTITWVVDGTLIATLDTETLSGDNIFFGHSDTNAASSTDPNDVNLLFTLIDNIHVVPEPSMFALAACGLIAAAAQRVARRLFTSCP